MKRNLNLLAAAFALTALSYGLARFSYGLLLPLIREELSLGVTVAGWIGGSAFAAYCVGIILTFICAGKLSPRLLAFSAGLAATLGMALVVFASSGLTLGLGIALAGLSTGLTSPPLACAVAARFNGDGRPKANALINAGTAAGIVFSGGAALIAAGAWRELYALYALMGAGITVWIWFAMPARPHNEMVNGFAFKLLRRPGLFALCSSAFLMGVASTAIWTFGAEILRGEFGFSDAYIAWAWIALGAAGISGSSTGMLTSRFGTRRIHSVALLGMAIGTIGLATASMSATFGFAAMCLFGAAYIVSTGAYLIQGINLFPDRPDLGLGIPFLVIALGQTIGTPLFGATLEATGVINALGVFAASACIAIFLRPTQALKQSGVCVP
ncbi:MFS transporter [Pseudomonas mucidolens]|uniref:Predicted arabinose efflux permease, MFS family n=1 Tax=Pseudomonas mucidolens TaxID=46679 RepID=A0A1H2P3R2_9PSED|nr:MFS transporter [Pseudomonas mucidolens]SDV12322.1 Predicted arabinose efflux permease, MFS family [Pseudomonas mucidolens]SQH36270.1 major facilitator superfamily transporter [Pseudomonas mucidolens]